METTHTMSGALPDSTLLSCGLLGRLLRLLVSALDAISMAMMFFCLRDRRRFYFLHRLFLGVLWFEWHSMSVRHGHARDIEGIAGMLQCVVVQILKKMCGRVVSASVWHGVDAKNVSHFLVVKSCGTLCHRSATFSSFRLLAKQTVPVLQHSSSILRSIRIRLQL